MDKRMQKIINGLVDRKEKNEDNLNALKTQWEDVSEQLHSLREKKEEVSARMQEIRRHNREISEKVESLHVIGNELQKVKDVIDLSDIMKIGEGNPGSKSQKRVKKEIKIKPKKVTGLPSKIEKYVRKEVIDDMARTFNGQKVKKCDLHSIIKKSHDINTENSMRVTTSWYIKYMCEATDLIEEKGVHTLKFKNAADIEDARIFEDVEEYESPLVMSAKEEIFR